MSVTLILFSLMNLGFFRKKVAGKGPWEHASRMVCAMSMHISKKLFLKRRWWLMLLRRAAMLLDAEEHWRLPDEDYRVLYPSWKIKDDKEKKDWTGHVSISFITSSQIVVCDTLMWGLNNYVIIIIKSVIEGKGKNSIHITVLQWMPNTIGLVLRTSITIIIIKG